MIINGDGGYGLLAAYRRACGSSRLACSKGRRPPGAVLYSSRETSELSQWLCHNDSTIKYKYRRAYYYYCCRRRSWNIHLVPLLSCHPAPLLLSPSYLSWMPRRSATNKRSKSSTPSCRQGQYGTESQTLQTVNLSSVARGARPEGANRPRAANMRGRQNGGQIW